MNNNYTKCSFCKYYSGRNCMAKPDSFYCKEAINEYYAWLKTKQPLQPAKSLRPWERKK